MSEKCLLDQWRDMAYDRELSKEQLEKFWGRYFSIERGIYEQLLTEPDVEVKGTVKELAEKYGQEVLTMVGFLDGINDSLKVPNPIETMTEDTEVNLIFDSTFARFWLVAGIGHFLMIPATKEEVTRKLLFFCVAGIWILFLAVEFFIVRAMRPGRKKNCRYLIVLGAQVRGERITDSLKRRLDAALLYHQVCSSVKIIVSGGQGKGEDVSEAYAMAQYLREHGVKDEQIMLEDQSRTTRENLRFSKAYLEELKTPVGIVTNNFHLFRALLIGRSEGYENLTGIAAGCNRILFLNYMVREFFAAVWLWIQRVKKKSG